MTRVGELGSGGSSIESTEPGLEAEVVLRRARIGVGGLDTVGSRLGEDKGAEVELRRVTIGGEPGSMIGGRWDSDRMVALSVDEVDVKACRDRE
jgi:hypothetical protein